MVTLARAIGSPDKAHLWLHPREGKVVCLYHGKGGRCWPLLSAELCTEGLYRPGCLPVLLRCS